ncbi:MAG: TetR/AcrR family transcriptional regulator [Clostridiales bacterium]|nr:TetR/AcrR family transcriptional regulator [Clostridiales bacterium]
MGKAEENKRFKRNTLLSKSYDLFTTKGISDTSISDIVNSAGVAKGTFYFYFKDKQDIIDHLVARKSETILLNALTSLERRREVEPDISTIDMIIAICDSLVTDLSKDPKLAKFLNRNLSLGFYHKAVTDDTLITSVNVHEEYEKILHSNGSQWKDELIMLYTLIEFVSSTAHNIILENRPCDLDTYRPYMYECIRKICEVFEA